MAMSGKAMQEALARGEAARLARQIGDEEWKQGNTKYALEAWEASNITPEELLDLAKKLFLIAPRIEGFWRKERNARQVIADSQNAQCEYATIYNWEVYSKTCNHPQCQARLDLLRSFYKEVCTTLGWTEVKLEGFFQGTGTTFMSSSFYRAAAVNCLKVIKRMR